MSGCGPQSYLQEIKRATRENGCPCSGAPAQIAPRGERRKDLDSGRLTPLLQNPIESLTAEKRRRAPYDRTRRCPPERKMRPGQAAGEAGTTTPPSSTTPSSSAYGGDSPSWSVSRPRWGTVSERAQSLRRRNEALGRDYPAGAVEASDRPRSRKTCAQIAQAAFAARRWTRSTPEIRPRRSIAAQLTPGRGRSDLRQ